MLVHKVFFVVIVCVEKPCHVESIVVKLFVMQGIAPLVLWKVPVPVIVNESR